MRAQKHEDLDEVASKAEIGNALAEQFKLHDLQEAIIVNLRMAYRATQTATIRSLLDGYDKPGHIP